MKITRTLDGRGATPRLLVYGPGGVGKSSFAAGAPSPLFIAAEDGLANIDTRAVSDIATWVDVVEAVRFAATADCGAVVIDSLDWCEPLCWAHVCKRAGKPDIEAFGYGKGYVAALDEWRLLLAALEGCRREGKHIVLIAHAHRKPFRNPEGDDYERWVPKLHEKAAGLIQEWVDVQGFASHEVHTSDASGRPKGFATGRRVLRCNPAAGYEAKTRFALPPIIPLDWQSFEAARSAATDVTPLREQLGRLLEQAADPQLTERALGYVETRGSTVAAYNDAIATVQQYKEEEQS